MQEHTAPVGVPGGGGGGYQGGGGGGYQGGGGGYQGGGGGYQGAHRGGGGYQEVSTLVYPYWGLNRLSLLRNKWVSQIE